MKRLVPLGLPELPIAAGATTPNPGTAALVWSTVNGAVIVWTGSAWALADTTGAGGGTGGTTPPAGANGAVQFNNAGAFAGAALTQVNADGQLNLLPGGFSGNPTSGGILGMLSAAQYGVPAFEGMTGMPLALGQHLGLGRRFVMARAVATSATPPSLLGLAAALTTGSTLTTRLPNATSAPNRVARIGLVSAATAGAIATYYFSAVTTFFVGNGAGLGGLLACFRFVPSDAAPVAGARMFVGMASTAAAPTNVEPNTLTNSIGIAQLSTSTNAHIVYGGSAAQTAIDLGANFPMGGASDSLYDLILYAPPNSSTTVYYEVRRYTTSSTPAFVATGTLTAATAGTQLPRADTSLTPRGWRTNNATALAVGWDLAHIYVEDASL